MIERRNHPVLYRSRRGRGPSILSLSMLRIFGYAIFIIGIISSLCGLLSSSSYKRKTTELKKITQKQQTLKNYLEPPYPVSMVQRPRTLLRPPEQEQEELPASSPPALLNPLLTSLSASETDVAPTLPPSPVRRINLLFDDKANPLLARHLTERVPVLPDDPRFHIRHREVTVTILRPPGVFGSIIEGFVRQCIYKNIDDETEHIDLNIHATSNIDHPPPFKRWSETIIHQEHYYIHAMTLPVLLEAIDLVMLTLDDNRPVILQSGGVPLSWRDLIDSVNLLVRWHCRVSNLAKTLQQIDDSSYVMNLSLQSTLEHPLKAEIELLNFLGVQPADDNLPYPTLIDRTNFTDAAWNRVHQATMLFRAMDSASLLPTPVWFSGHPIKGHNIDNILDLQVQGMLEHEMPSPDHCPTDPYLQYHSMSVSLNIIQQLLNNKSLATVCQQQIPGEFSASITICRYKDEYSYYPRLIQELYQEADPNVLFLSIFCQGHPERFDLCDNDKLLLAALKKSKEDSIRDTYERHHDHDDDPVATSPIVMDQFVVKSQPDTNNNNNNNNHMFMAKL